MAKTSKRTSKKRSTHKPNRLKWGAILSCTILCLLLWSVFREMPLKGNVTHIAFDRDDTQDSIYTKLADHTGNLEVLIFKALAKITQTDKRVHIGYYQIQNTSVLTFFRRYRNKQQAEVRLKINNTVRTTSELAAMLGKQLLLTPQEIEDSLLSTNFCTRYGFTTATIIACFVPNTYNVYWDISMESLLKRMKREYNIFWTEQRLAQAKTIGYTPIEVVTLASIVEEETSYAPEKSAVAGMYINRLNKGMRLQADPTVKFAVGNFSLRRILLEHLQVQHAYNTYLNDGLPPGPIRLPSIATVDAVLNRETHDYLYMCAKEDFSGAHNFAITYSEHLQNAARYRKALDKRGIK